jgi:choline-sulfatase
MLGDHEEWGKGVPLQPSIGVPLLISGPGVQQGAVVKEPTTILDLTATFLEAAELEIPRDMDSRSLLPRLTGDVETHREVAFTGLRDWRVALGERYKLVHRQQDSPLLYDLEEDPHETEDVSAERPDEVRRLSQQLRAHLKGDESVR